MLEPRRSTTHIQPPWLRRRSVLLTPSVVPFRRAEVALCEIPSRSHLSLQLFQFFIDRMQKKSVVTLASFSTKGYEKTVLWTGNYFTSFSEMLKLNASKLNFWSFPKGSPFLGVSSPDILVLPILLCQSGPLGYNHYIILQYNVSPTSQITVSK